MTGYANEIYSCAVCSKTFPKYTLLKRHLLAEHSEGHLYSCEYCDRQFSQKCNLQRHSRMHTGERPYNCAICSKGFTQKGNLERHMGIHTGNKPYACSFCDKKFTQHGNLKTHLLRHTGDRPFKCHVCNKGFAVKGNLDMHLIRHTNDQCYICEVCNEGFLSKDIYIKHMLTHNVAPVYTCKVCLDNFESEAQLSEHMSIHNSRARESLDRKKTNNATTDNNKKILKHNNKKLYVCDTCKEGFLDKNQFRDHVLIHSKQRIDSLEASNATTTTKENNKKIINNFTLDAHHACATCGSKFTTKSNLNRHIRTHMDEYYTCNICGDKFNHQSNYKRHLDMHSNTKPYKCNICPKEFLQKSNLKRHMSSHQKMQRAVVEELYPKNEDISNLDQYNVKAKYYDDFQNGVVYEDSDLPIETINIEIDDSEQNKINENEREQTFSNIAMYEQKLQLFTEIHVNLHDEKQCSTDNVLNANTNTSKIFQNVIREGKLISQFEIYEDKLCRRNDMCLQSPNNDVYANNLSHSTCLEDTDRDTFYMCDKCGESFEENYKLEQHLLTHNDDPIIVIVV